MYPSTGEPIHIYRFSAGGWEFQENRVIDEANVSLTVNGDPWLNFTCTPAHLEELCVGFLFNEGIIHTFKEIKAISLCANKSNVDIWLDRSVEKPTQWSRTSGCTGGITFHNGEMTKGVSMDARFSSAAVGEGMKQLLEAQTLYRETRGLHCSAIFDGQNLHFIAEDIGRHNTLDKLAGMILLNPKGFQPVLVFTTGRVSSEMLQKSARLGAIAVISRTSPTALSVKLANQLGVTLIGYARRDQFTVYSHPKRIKEFNQKASKNSFSEIETQSPSFSA
jgi:FdhD protein